MSARNDEHIPVLLDEVLAHLDPKENCHYLDCTFGGGGHTSAILNTHNSVQVVALDKDPAAHERAKSIKSHYGNRLRLYDLSFGDLDQVEENHFAGILFDLGVSSFQLDQGDRGFSFRFAGESDMRLNPRQGISAEDFLEQAKFEDLVQAVRDFGEERSWRKVVDAIIDARSTGSLKKTDTLAELIAKAAYKTPGSKIHPATKTFQGIRMWVNDELGELERALPKAFDKLDIGGLLAIISFHSLEDRIVKRFYKRMAGRPEHRNDNTAQDSRIRYAKIITGKPIIPTEKEQSLNPRSRSARMRILLKERHTS